MNVLWCNMKTCLCPQECSNLNALIVFLGVQGNWHEILIEFTLLETPNKVVNSAS